MPKELSACFIVHEWSRSSLLSGASADGRPLSPFTAHGPTGPALLVVQATVKKFPGRSYDPFTIFHFHYFLFTVLCYSVPLCALPFFSLYIESVFSCFLFYRNIRTFSSVLLSTQPSCTSFFFLCLCHHLASLRENQRSINSRSDPVWNSVEGSKKDWECKGDRERGITEKFKLRKTDESLWR